MKLYLIKVVKKNQKLYLAGGMTGDGLFKLAQSRGAPSVDLLLPSPKSSHWNLLGLCLSTPGPVWLLSSPGMSALDKVRLWPWRTRGESGQRQR